jgi:hypothetical protein
LAYQGSGEPRFAFIANRYEILRHHPAVSELMQRCFVKDATDLNAHCALHLQVLTVSGGLMACISCVSPWGMLFRCEGNEPRYVSVIDSAAQATSAEESDVLMTLRCHGVVLVSKEEARERVDVELVDADPSNTIVYHAIVSDEVFIPDVLLH